MASAVERARQERQRIVQETPIPAPEIPSRPIPFGELPFSARGIVEKAHAAGFRMGAWESRGPRIGSDGQPLDIRNAIGVRGNHPNGDLFAAMWMQDLKPSGQKQQFAWKFDFAHVHDADGYARVNSDDLKAFINRDRERVQVL